MMRDPYVRKSYRIIVSNLITGSYGFEPAVVGDDLRELATEAAEFGKWAFTERLNFKSLIKRQCVGFRDGVSLLEAMTDSVEFDASRFPNHPGKGRAISFSRFCARPAWSITEWHASKTEPEALGHVVQWCVDEDGTPQEKTIPATNLIRFTYDQEDRNWAGMALLRSAYGPWKAKVLLQVVEAILHERTGAGVPTIQLPEKTKKEDRKRAEQILSAMRAHQKGYMILPFGYQFTWSTVNGDIAKALAEAIRRCNEDILANIGAAFLLLGQGMRSSGSNALAQTQRGEHQLTIETFATDILECWNFGNDGWSPVKSLIAWNYGDRLAELITPRLVVRNLPSREWSGVIPLLIQAAQSKLIRISDPLEAFILNALQAPAFDPETEREANPDPNPAQAQLPANQEPVDEDEELGEEEQIAKLIHLAERRGMSPADLIRRIEREAA